MKRQNVRTLSLIVFTFTYLLVGAAVFDALESSNELKLTQELHNQENSWRRKYNMTRDNFKNLTSLIIKMKPYKAGTQWKFAGSFYFATTVITTIGYGHSTPKTNGGKIFCMLYALPGIPLCIVMFQSIGERMNTFITSTIKFLKRSFKLSGSNEVSHTSLMLISSNITIIVILVGASVFQYYENWTYLDSFYYCFITLTTIGFGDFVALQRNDTLAKRPDYVAFSLIFILFGLTVVSSVMNLLVLRFLTMNTEDERRDEIQAAAAAVYAYDQLRSHNNSITNSHLEPNNIHHHHHYQLPFHPTTNEFNQIQTNNGINIDNNNNDNNDHNDSNDKKDSSIIFYSCCCCFNNSVNPKSQPRNTKFKISDNYSFINRYNNLSFNYRLRHLFCFPCLNNSVGVSDYQLKRKRYTVIRDPAKVHHLAHSNCSTNNQAIPQLINSGNRSSINHNRNRQNFATSNRRYISKSVRKSNANDVINFHHNGAVDFTAQHDKRSSNNNYLCLPQQSNFMNTQYYHCTNGSVLEHNYNELDPGSTTQDNDLINDADLENIDDELLLDKFSLNSIRKTRRISI